MTPEQIRSNLADLKKKRIFLNERIATLSPELRVEVELRKHRLRVATRVIDELRVESKPIYNEILKAKSQTNRILPIVSAICIFCYYLTTFFGSKLHWQFAFITVFIGAAFSYFSLRLDLLQMQIRLDHLTDKMSSAKDDLYIYGIGELDSYHRKANAENEFPKGSEGEQEGLFLRSAEFEIELEESVLRKMGFLEFLELQLKTNWS